MPSAAEERLFVECRRAQVPVDATRPDNPQCLESVRPLNLNRHSASPEIARPKRRHRLMAVQSAASQLNGKIARRERLNLARVWRYSVS